MKVKGSSVVAQALETVKKREALNSPKHKLSMDKVMQLVLKRKKEIED